GGDELLLELGLDGRAGVAALRVDPRLGMGLRSQRKHSEEDGPPDRQVDRGHGKRATHQCASLGVSISSTSTPPMSLGWTKITGTPWAPIRGSPVPSTVAPLARMSSRAARMSGTSKQTWCCPPLGFFSRNAAIGEASP